MNDSRPVARLALMLAGAIVCASAGAQTASTSGTAAERAQQQADRPLYWIRLLADKPVAKPTPAPAVARPAARPAVATSEQRAPERLKVAAASTLPAETGGSVVTPVASRLAVAAASPAAMPAAGGLAGGMAAPAIAAGLAAPTLTPPPVDIPAPESEEPDPGLVMTASVDPQFPMPLMRRLRQGEVEVKFEVGADGQVALVSVVKTTNSNLNSAALDAVRQWRFKAGPKAHVALVDLAFDLDK